MSHKRVCNFIYSLAAPLAVGPFICSTSVNMKEEEEKEVKKHYTAEMVKVKVKPICKLGE